MMLGAPQLCAQYVSVSELIEFEDELRRRIKESSAGGILIRTFGRLSDFNVEERTILIHDSSPTAAPEMVFKMDLRFIGKMTDFREAKVVCYGELRLADDPKQKSLILRPFFLDEADGLDAKRYDEAVRITRKQLPPVEKKPK